MFRNIRTFSSFSRSLFRPRSSLLQHNGAVTIRRVRVVRPVFTARRVQTVALWTLSLGGFSYLIGLLDEEDDEEEAAVKIQPKAIEAPKATEQPLAYREEGETEEIDGEDEVEEEEEEEEEEGEEGEEDGDEGEDEVLIPDEPPEDSWFIPLGLARQRPQTFYRGSDPEWQSFVEFSRDRKRSFYIQNELAGLVGNYMADLRQFQKFLGTPIQTGKYWLDIDFPDGPPPEYERAGLEIAEDYIAWTVRPVSSINVSRLNGTLWPTATFSSLWASSQALWQLQLAKVKDLLNIKVDSETKKPRFPPGYVNLPRLAKPKDEDATPSAPTAPEVKQPESSPSPSSSLPAGSERSKILWPLPSIPKPSTEMATVSMAFKDNLAKNWRAASEPAPRGTFMVSGLVEVLGPKGVCVLDVRAAYHPRESRWVAIGMAVRRLQKKKQSPKGGS